MYLSDLEIYRHMGYFVTVTYILNVLAIFVFLICVHTNCTVLVVHTVYKGARDMLCTWFIMSL